MTAYGATKALISGATVATVHKVALRYPASGALIAPPALETGFPLTLATGCTATFLLYVAMVAGLARCGIAL